MSQREIPTGLVQTQKAKVAAHIETMGSQAHRGGEEGPWEVEGQKGTATEPQARIEPIQGLF